MAARAQSAFTTKARFPEVQRLAKERPGARELTEG
jgi:hypothetical protein